MPIRRELRPLYPPNWGDISYYVRFVREQGVCEHCGRRHGEHVRRLSDGRWYDSALGRWRDGMGRECEWPNLLEYGMARETRVILATAHLDNNPAHNDEQNWAALCQRCHLLHDAKYHQMQRRLTIRARNANGDLFMGDYAALKLALALSKVTFP